MDTANDSTVLRIEDLQVGFRSVAGRTRAVNGVNLEVRHGEIVGLVGESGCGKSVTIRSIVGLVPCPPATMEGGQVWMRTREGMTETLSLYHDERAMRRIRGRDVAMIFQEPMRSLHPMMPIGPQIVEGILEHEVIEAKEAYDRAENMLDLVGLPQPRDLLGRYAHELSGGMRQRVLIALALVCKPQLLLADEPTTALDVTIQAQILDLIRDLRERLGMSVLLVTHNMGVVASLADRVSVMYLGKIVETGSVYDVFRDPSHPYTMGLIRSMPDLFGKQKTRLNSLPGTVPELAMAPKGCVFADRCEYSMPICRETPPLVALQGEHYAACWLYDNARSTAGRVRTHNGNVSASAGVDEGAAGAASQPSRASLTVPVATEAVSEAPMREPDVAPDCDAPILEMDDMSLRYPLYKGLVKRQVGEVRAVDGVDLRIGFGETLGLVGESGCGKTSVGRLVTRLVDATGGTIRFLTDDGIRDITHISQRDMNLVRRRMGMVFQDPLSSLNPRMNVRNIVGEPLILHKLAKGKAIDRRVGELLETVGLRAEHQSRFPHAFSGGQRQRIAIARALATEPRFLVADEPVSALDVSVQAQILNLLLHLQQQLGLTMLFIAHDIAVVRHVSDRMAVMYLGQIVETGQTQDVCSHPIHPYTEALLASIPLPVPGFASARRMVVGDLPSPSDPPRGCRFHTRCPYARPECSDAEPRLQPAKGNAAHLGACHFQDELRLAGVEQLLPESGSPLGQD